MKDDEITKEELADLKRKAGGHMDSEREIGRMGAKIDELERALKEVQTAKHTCTGDSCHVLGDREKELTAQVQALQLQVEQFMAGGAKPAAASSSEPEIVECPTCQRDLSIPPNVADNSWVECSSCGNASRVKREV